MAERTKRNKERGVLPSYEDFVTCAVLTAPEDAGNGCHQKEEGQRQAERTETWGAPGVLMVC